MGTRSITVVKDEDNKKIIEIYQQFDGYIEGVGKELLDFTNSGKLVNGFGNSDTRQFNGIECFAAQLVEHLKNGVGGTYLHAPTTDYKRKKEYYEIYSAEYYYEIDHKLNIRCWDTYDNKEIDLNKLLIKD